MPSPHEAEGVALDPLPQLEHAQRTVYNLYSVLCALFRDAQLDGLIDSSPCVLTDVQLGPKVDKVKGWRKSAVFTRDEVIEIISTDKIPLDRRVCYGLELLAGIRSGETAALRWTNYDATTKPLGQLHVMVALNSKKFRVKGTKTEAEKFIPVHPVLAKLLAEWRIGWGCDDGP